MPEEKTLSEKIVSEKIVIQGNRPLHGVVKISGAKNSVLKLMAASLLSSKPVTLHNVPQLTDVRVMTDVVRHLGCQAVHAEDVMTLHTPDITCMDAPYELVSKMRASFNVLGALLGRCHQAHVSLPGGCSIGQRGVDLHIKGLQALGAEVTIAQGYVNAQVSPDFETLHGADIHLDIPSVGATENIMLAAVLAQGTTVISNAAQEPEIEDLANFINMMGGHIEGAGTKELIIHGVPQESLGSAIYSVMPDRIEAATFMMAAAGTPGSDVVLDCVMPGHLASVTHKLAEAGVQIDLLSPNQLRIKAPEKLIATNAVTQPYPGFPTDLQAPLMAMLAIADGVSILHETIYENRFKQIGELARMGADIQQDGNMAVVNGVALLSGTQVSASDLRAGAALVIAGLLAQGQTEIFNLSHLDRGYEALPQKFAALGARICRVSETHTVDDADFLVSLPKKA